MSEPAPDGMGPVEQYDPSLWPAEGEVDTPATRRRRAIALNDPKQLWTFPVGDYLTYGYYASWVTFIIQFGGLLLLDQVGWRQWLPLLTAFTLLFVVLSTWLARLESGRWAAAFLVAAGGVAGWSVPLFISFFMWMDVVT